MAVVLTYLTMPVNGAPTLGGTIPPTAAQNQFLNIECVQAAFLDADTTISLVHNWGLSAAQQAVGYPITRATCTANGGTVLPIFSYAFGANTVTVTKNTAAGTASTFIFQLERPHSLIQ